MSAAPADRTRHITISEARKGFSDVVNRVAYGGERIVIECRGKSRQVALVSGADLELLEAIEDRIDVEEALKALKKPGGISLDEFEKELGL